MADSIGTSCSVKNPPKSSHASGTESADPQSPPTPPKDRVFVHALNTVKRIPRTGSARPPESDRLKLYGLYKQATEGDVAGLMPRPWVSSSSSSFSSASPFFTTSNNNNNNNDNNTMNNNTSSVHMDRETFAERGKWDAWDSNKGLSKTEAKRRYIASLIGTMHRYATTTPEARELVGELEFVWDQVRSLSASESGSLGSAAGKVARQGGKRDKGAAAIGGGGGAVVKGLRVLRPMSDDDVAGHDDMMGGEIDEDDGEDFQDTRGEVYELGEGGTAVPEFAGGGSRSAAAAAPIQSMVGADVSLRDRKWRRRMEQVLVNLSVEIAALREQIERRTDGGGLSGRNGGMLGWAKWFLSGCVRHALIDGLFILFLGFWARARGDQRLERNLRIFYFWIKELVGRTRVPRLFRRAVKIL